MNIIDRIRAEKKEISVRLFEGRCFVCRRKFGKGFGFHHRRYLKGEKKILDSLSKNKLKYWNFVKITIRSEPERFFCVCKVCHNRSDGLRIGLSRIKKDVLRRLLLMVFMTEK